MSSDRLLYLWGLETQIVDPKVKIVQRLPVALTMGSVLKIGLCPIPATTLTIGIMDKLRPKLQLE